MPECPSCGNDVEARFRYCPWCAEPARLKLVEFFPACPFPAESGKVLRVSRYFPELDKPGHVRFSVWDESGFAEAVLSLTESDAARLADFVCKSASNRAAPRRACAPRPTGIRSLLRRFTLPQQQAPRRSSSVADGRVVATGEEPENVMRADAATNSQSPSSADSEPNSG